MSLNNINLPPYLVAQLYPGSLVGSPGSVVSSPKEQQQSEPLPDKKEWKFLGSNQKRILIGVSYKDIPNLPDTQLDFLMQLLQACRLSLNDVALINIHNYQADDSSGILTHFRSEVVLLFGMSAGQFGFPFETPQYQVQKFADTTVLHAPALHDLQNDKPAKTKLWAGLKKIFSV